MRTARIPAIGGAMSGRDSLSSDWNSNSTLKDSSETAVTSLSRRGAISALTASIALLADHAAAAEAKLPPVDETPRDRVGRLSEELAEALLDWTGGQFKAVVYPANHERFPGRLMLIDCVVADGGVS